MTPPDIRFEQRCMTEREATAAALYRRYLAKTFGCYVDWIRAREVNPDNFEVTMGFPSLLKTIRIEGRIG